MVRVVRVLVQDHSQMVVWVCNVPFPELRHIMQVAEAGLIIGWTPPDMEVPLQEMLASAAAAKVVAAKVMVKRTPDRERVYQVQQILGVEAEGGLIFQMLGGWGVLEVQAVPALSLYNIFET